jgi:hypothetical protein
VSPTVLRAQGFRLLFFSREETRMHVHYTRLMATQNSGLSRKSKLAQSYGLPAHEVSIALQLIRENEDVIRRAWQRDFGS